jgi:hypothetical protein
LILQPCVAWSSSVGHIGTLGDDAFEILLDGYAEKRVAVRLDVLD